MGSTVATVQCVQTAAAGPASGPAHWRRLASCEAHPPTSTTSAQARANECVRVNVRTLLASRVARAPFPPPARPGQSSPSASCAPSRRRSVTSELRRWMGLYRSGGAHSPAEGSGSCSSAAVGRPESQESRGGMLSATGNAGSAAVQTMCGSRSGWRRTGLLGVGAA